MISPLMLRVMQGIVSASVDHANKVELQNQTPEDITSTSHSIKSHPYDTSADNVTIHDNVAITYHPIKCHPNGTAARLAIGGTHRFCSMFSSF